MQFITGRVVVIGNKRVINTDNGSFSAVILVLKKKMNGKVRHIAFHCYGHVADKVLKFRIDDKLEVEYFIYSKSFKRKNGTHEYENWDTTLQAKSVDRYSGVKKWNDRQLQIDS